MDFASSTRAAEDRCKVINSAPTTSQRYGICYTRLFKINRCDVILQLGEKISVQQNKYYFGINY